MTSDERKSYLSSYFSTSPLSLNWFDIIDPQVISNLPSVNISASMTAPYDKRAIKALFRDFGVVANESDGLRVTFPAASAGKMLFQSGSDIRCIAPSFKMLFEKSHRAWNEREVPMANHKFHFNVKLYSNYICRFQTAIGEYFIRFTIRHIGAESSVHASTISDVTVYRKTEGIPTDSHPENPEDGHRMPFIDHKIAHFLSACQGGADA